MMFGLSGLLIVSLMPAAVMPLPENCEQDTTRSFTQGSQ
jgi:hypothetical protein